MDDTRPEARRRKMENEALPQRYRNTGDHHRERARALREAGKILDTRHAEETARLCYERAEEIEGRNDR